MPYKYLEEIASADVAFHAWGENINEMFLSAADATLNVLIEDIHLVKSSIIKECHLQEEALDVLLYKFLEQIVFYKDAENLLLKAVAISVKNEGEIKLLDGEFLTEKIDPSRHKLYLDIKAITLCELKVFYKNGLWESIVVVDV